MYSEKELISMTDMLDTLYLLALKYVSHQIRFWDAGRHFEYGGETGHDHDSRFVETLLTEQPWPLFEIFIMYVHVCITNNVFD